MTPPSKILLVFPVGERGGAEHVFISIAQHLDRRRFEPVAWFLRPGPLVEEVQALGVKTSLTPITRLSDLLNFWQTVSAGQRLITREGIRLVLSSLGYGHLYGGAAAYRAGAMAAWWQHGMASPMNWIDRFAVSIPSKLIITSSYIAARAHREAFGTKGTCLEVIHPGIDMTTMATDQMTVRQELGIAPDAVVVAAVGRLQPGKGQDMLLRAGASVMGRHPPVTIMLVGSEMFGMNQGYEHELRQLASGLGLDAYVIFTGFRQDVPRVWSVVDIFVHPATAPESFGLAVVEAMAAGKPVIVTDVGGPAEIVTHGQTGLVIQPNDESQLSEALRLLLENPQLGQTLGQAARAHARAHFSQAAMIRKVETALTSVLGG